MYDAFVIKMIPVFGLSINHAYLKEVCSVYISLKIIFIYFSSRKKLLLKIPDRIANCMTLTGRI